MPAVPAQVKKPDAAQQAPAAHTAQQSAATPSPEPQSAATPQASRPASSLPAASAAATAARPAASTATPAAQPAASATPPAAQLTPSSDPVIIPVLRVVHGPYRDRSEPPPPLRRTPRAHAPRKDRSPEPVPAPRSATKSKDTPQSPPNPPSASPKAASSKAKQPTPAKPQAKGKSPAKAKAAPKVGVKKKATTTAFGQGPSKQVLSKEAEKVAQAIQAAKSAQGGKGVQSPQQAAKAGKSPQAAKKGKGQKGVKAAKSAQGAARPVLKKLAAAVAAAGAADAARAPRPQAHAASPKKAAAGTKRKTPEQPAHRPPPAHQPNKVAAVAVKQEAEEQGATGVVSVRDPRLAVKRVVPQPQPPPPPQPAQPVAPPKTGAQVTLGIKRRVEEILASAVRSRDPRLAMGPATKRVPATQPAEARPTEPRLGGSRVFSTAPAAMAAPVINTGVGLVGSAVGSGVGRDPRLLAGMRRRPDPRKAGRAPSGGEGAAAAASADAASAVDKAATVAAAEPAAPVAAVGHRTSKRRAAAAAVAEVVSRLKGPWRPAADKPAPAPAAAEAASAASVGPSAPLQSPGTRPGPSLQYNPASPPPALALPFPRLPVLPLSHPALARNPLAAKLEAIAWLASRQARAVRAMQNAAGGSEQAPPQNADAIDAHGSADPNGLGQIDKPQHASPQQQGGAGSRAGGAAVDAQALLACSVTTSSNTVDPQGTAQQGGDRDARVRTLVPRGQLQHAKSPQAPPVAAAAAADRAQPAAPRPTSSAPPRLVATSSQESHPSTHNHMAAQPSVSSARGTTPPRGVATVAAAAAAAGAQLTDTTPTGAAAAAAVAAAEATREQNTTPRPAAAASPPASADTSPVDLQRARVRSLAGIPEVATQPRGGEPAAQQVQSDRSDVSSLHVQPEVLGAIAAAAVQHESEPGEQAQSAQDKGGVEVEGVSIVGPSANPVQAGESEHEVPPGGDEQGGQCAEVQAQGTEGTEAQGQGRPTDDTASPVGTARVTSPQQAEVGTQAEPAAGLQPGMAGEQAQEEPQSEPVTATPAEPHTQAQAELGLEAQSDGAREGAAMEQAQAEPVTAAGTELVPHVQAEPVPYTDPPTGKQAQPDTGVQVGQAGEQAAHEPPADAAGAAAQQAVDTAQPDAQVQLHVKLPLQPPAQRQQQTADAVRVLPPRQSLSVSPEKRCVQAQAIVATMCQGPASPPKEALGSNVS